jgi:hypothetical protein
VRRAGVGTTRLAFGVKRRFLVIPSGEGVLDLRARRGAPIKAVQKSAACRALAGESSRRFSRFSGEKSLGTAIDFWTFGIGPKVSKVQKLSWRTSSADDPSLPGDVSEG